MTSFLILLVLLTLSTVGIVPTGRTDDGPYTAAQAVAFVNGTPIRRDRLDLAVNALIPQASFHRGVSPERIADLRRTALDTLVDEELQYQDAARRGVHVSDTEITTALAEAMAQYESPQAFASARRRAHLTGRAVRDEIRRQIMIRKAHDDAVTSRCRVDRLEAAGFYDANRERFVVPEEIRLQAITIGVDPGSPPAAWAEAKARAHRIRQELVDGAAFDSMVREHSTDPSRDAAGDMGFFHRGSLLDEFEEATRALRPGEVSAVVSTIYGYHLVRITDVRPSRQKTFDEVASELLDDLTTRRCAELKSAWIGRLRAGATIELTDRPAGRQASASPGRTP